MTTATTSESHPLSSSPFIRFFSVVADPRAYGALLYMVLALFLGIAYFTFVSVGVSLSLSLMILIIGVPIALLFLASVRLLSNFEAHLVRLLLGAEIPERETDHSDGQTLWLRIKNLFTDHRTWTSMLYFTLMLALGTAYFSIAVTVLSIVAALAISPTLHFFLKEPTIIISDGTPSPLLDWLHQASTTPIGMAAITLLGIFLFFVALHGAKGIGKLHGRIAETLLVRI